MMKFKFLKTLILIICSLFTHSRKIKRKDPLRFSAGSFLGKGTFGSVYEYTTKFSQTVFAIKFIGSNKRKFLEELSILIQICPSKTYPFTDLTQSPPTKSTVETFVLHEGQDGELFIYDNGEMELFYLVSEFKKVQDKCVGTALFSFGEKDNQYYFVFKKFDGTLKDYLAKERKESEKIEIFIKLAGMLNDLHAKNVQHRDIKPANILYDKTEDKFVFSDFGLSCFMTDNDCMKKISGSPKYIPYYIEDKPTTEAPFQNDYYALAIMFLEIVFKLKIPEVQNANTHINHKQAVDLSKYIKQDPKEFTAIEKDLLSLLRLPHSFDKGKYSYEKTSENLNLFIEHLKIEKSKLIENERN